MSFHSRFLSFLLLALFTSSTYARESRQTRHQFHDFYVGPHGELLASQDTGLFRSIDDGAHWTRVSALSTEYCGKLFNAGSNVVFADSIMGLYRSLDAGASWTRMGRSVTVAAIDMYGTLYGYAHHHSPYELYVSKDNGRSWRARPSTSVLPIANIDRRNILPARKALFATSGQWIHRSIDAGRTWDQLPTPVVAEDEFIKALHQDSTGKLYLSTAYFSGKLNEPRSHVYRSADRGRHWQRLDFGLDADAINVRILRIDKSTLRMACSIREGGAWPRHDSLCDSDGGDSLEVMYAGGVGGVYIADNLKIAPGGRRYMMGEHAIFSSDSSGKHWRKLGVKGLPDKYTGKEQTGERNTDAAPWRTKKPLTPG